MLPRPWEHPDTSPAGQGKLPDLVYATYARSGMLAPVSTVRRSEARRGRVLT
jgi:hypothetical protein